MTGRDPRVWSGRDASADHRVAGRAVYRVVWEPGSDRLHGICHCGAFRDADDPVEVWRWLLAHPAHETTAAPDIAPDQNAPSA
jgi:hypothetical protein